MSSERTVRSLLVGAAAVAVISAESGFREPSLRPPSASSDECAGRHGDYSAWDWYDPGGVCVMEFDFSDYWSAATYINDVGCFGSSPQCGQSCRDVEDYLLTQAHIYEWTGWFETEYWWDARWDASDEIGFHYDYIDDAGLWAHEGYHGWNQDSDEFTAQAFQQYCPADFFW